MLITCPTCSATYRVPDDAIGPNGRNVQCDACGAQWRQEPEAEIDDPTLAERFLEDEADALGGSGEEAAPAAARSPRTPGLEEATDLLREMREESALAEAATVPGDQKRKTPPPPPIEKSENLVTEEEIRRTIASDAEETARTGATATSAAGAAATTVEPAHGSPSAGGGGFRVGFVLALMVAAVAAFAYLANGLLAEQFPAAASMLGAYADAVDALRGQVQELAAGVMEQAESATQ